MESVRVGLIGVGTWGRNHARVLASLPDTKLVGFFDSDSNCSNEAADEWGGSSFPSMDKLIGECEAVIVAVPTVFHADATVAALEGGADVLVEKPIASTLQEADRMLDAADRAGKILVVGHLERFNPAVEALLDASRTPRFAEVHRLSAFHLRGLDVSVVLDLMIHDLDILLRLAGSPLLEVRAVGVPVLSPTIDIANARLQFENGMVANLTASRISLTKTRKIRVFEQDTYLSVDFTTQEIACYRRTGPPPPPEALTPEAFQQYVRKEDLGVVKEEPLRREVERFLAASRGDSVSNVTGQEGREALQLAIRILDEIDGARG